MKSSERPFPTYNCEQLCEFFGAFYKPLPELSQIPNVDRWLEQTYPPDQLAIQVSFQGLNTSHFPLIKSFFEHGLVGFEHHESVSNRLLSLDHYLGKIYKKHHKDLVVVIVTQPGDVVWSPIDEEGVRDGYPNIPYPQDKLLPPEFVQNGSSAITHIPPDRIVGFFYLPPQLYQTINNH